MTAPAPGLTREVAGKLADVIGGFTPPKGFA